MLIIALVLAVIGLAALVTAVVTSNELIAWVCIAASVSGVVLLIVDALQERSRREAGEDTAGVPPEGAELAGTEFDAEYPDEGERPGPEADTTAVEQADDEVADEDRNTR